MDVGEVAELIKAISGLLWIGIALFALFIFRDVLSSRGPLSKFGVGPTGLSMEFAEKKLEEASKGQPSALSPASKRGIARRLERSADVLDGARLLWVDDHPENNSSIVELLNRYGVGIDLALTNEQAFERLASTKYDVLLSDVGRDDESPNEELKGVEFADAVWRSHGMRVILFTARFDPLSVPGKSAQERLELAKSVSASTLGVTNRFDELLHLVLDALERI